MRKDEKILDECRSYIRGITDFTPKIALVLGSGLGGLADQVDVIAEVSYGKLKDFPVSTVSGHEGRYVFGTLGGVPVVVMQGRVHYYEGYPMNQVVLPIRLTSLLGAQTLLLTNAAGGINENFRVGDFMLITGQIANLVPSPLVGPNLDELGPRFPDMSGIYDKTLAALIRQAAEEAKVFLREGVYLQVSGPNYETPEEIKMFRLWGADAVGMSTAAEAIAARHMGMKICGISCISNMAAGIQKTALSHEEVKNTTEKAAESFERLIIASVKAIEKA